MTEAQRGGSSRTSACWRCHCCWGFSFWAVATEAEDPTNTRTSAPATPVEIRGLPDDMTAYGAENTVESRDHGPPVRVGPAAGR